MTNKNYVAFNFAYGKEDKIYLKLQRKFLTEDVAKKDNLRDFLTWLKKK